MLRKCQNEKIIRNRLLLFLYIECKKKKEKWMRNSYFTMEKDDVIHYLRRLLFLCTFF